MEKVTRENLAEHLVNYQLEMVGKTWEDALVDQQWYYNITMTQQQFDEFMEYALPLTKKVLKCNKLKAQRALDWFNLQFGLRIYPPPMELNSKPFKNFNDGSN
jgi:beta-xylosidase